MGSFFARVFERAGCRVIGADIGTALRASEVAARADIVLVAVPIDATVALIREIGPLVRPDALLVDVTSVKAEPVNAMLEHARSEVIGLHPMFGPGVSGLAGQLVVMCPARAPVWRGWMEDTLASQGAVVQETTPEEHDRAMAVVQALRHCVTIAMGRALAGLGVDPEDSLTQASPIYRLELIMTARLFAQDPGLYAEIAMRNPQSDAVLEAFERAFGDVARQVREGDREGFVETFRETREAFGVFTERAMEESSRLLRRLLADGPEPLDR